MNPKPKLGQVWTHKIDPNSYPVIERNSYPVIERKIWLRKPMNQYLQFQTIVIEGVSFGDKLHYSYEELAKNLDSNFLLVEDIFWTCPKCMNFYLTEAQPIDILLACWLCSLT